MRPILRASCAVTGSPDRTISIAFDFPTEFVSLTVPPAPGIRPSLISGVPSLASSLAMIISQHIASSRPPPKAIPFTAAISGLRNFPMTPLQCLSDSLSNTYIPKSTLLITFIFAPVAKDLDPYLPVSTTAEILGST